MAMPGCCAHGCLAIRCQGLEYCIQAMMLGTALRQACGRNCAGRFNRSDQQLLMLRRVRLGKRSGGYLADMALLHNAVAQTSDKSIPAAGRIDILRCCGNFDRGFVSARPQHRDGTGAAGADDHHPLQRTVAFQTGDFMFVADHPVGQSQE